MTAADIRTHDTFDSLDPRTGAVLDSWPAHGAEDVEAAVARARTAATSWDDLGFAGREQVLLDWARMLVRRLDELADLVSAETGKPIEDACLEVLMAIEQLGWAARHAKRVLGRRHRAPGLLMVNHSATVEYRPLGVVTVIGPWNYPVYTPMGSIAYALAAGNVVVFKPSEYTPGVGAWLVDSLAELTDQPVLQLVTGDGETGRMLAAADVDKIAFTGSTATAKKVMATAADRLTPVLIECGGKDPLLVDADADVPAAAEAALWGGMSNAGQTCTGVERVYVHERVYDDFVDELTRLARKVVPGTHVGPITMPGQLDVIRSHIKDALSRGGRALVGGEDAVGDRYVQPTVLVDVPEDSIAVQHETFGPTLTVARVRDMDEAVELANATGYGLSSTVFSRSRGAELARRLRSGMTSVNAVISFVAMPTLPFGGVGDSGFGRTHGPDGLREFTYAKAVAAQKMRTPVFLTTFERTDFAFRALRTISTVLHSGSVRSRLRRGADR